MSRLEDRIFERLDRHGLARVLDDLLDQARLVKLANACGLKYPGTRTRSQSRTRILGDLLDRASSVAATRRAIHRTLQKETRTACRQWQALESEERQRRLDDEGFLRSDGNLGLHLYLTASLESDEASSVWTHLQGLVSNGGNGSAPAEHRPSRTELRLQKRTAELERKVQHLDGQLARAREKEKAAKRDLIQRKGELAEARMLNERLRAEIARLEVAVNKPAATEAVEQLSKTVRRLSTEQKKLTYAVQKRTSRDDAPAQADAALLEGSVELLKSLQREVGALKREQRKTWQQLAPQVDALTKGLDKVKEAAGAGGARKTRRGAAKRVGVFVDVQNMYYGARRLKGKLDFDALMEAAVLDRRLVHAAAYVVESKEIDQSGFIALLEQRGIEVRRKIVSVRADGSMKGDWDMELALDILDTAPDLDVVVLVSGDGDFTSLVKRVKKMGPRVEVVGFPRTTAKALVGAADRFQPLDRKFMIYKRQKSSTAAAGATRAPASTKQPPEA